METWIRLPLTLRILIIAAVWFGYAVLVLDLTVTPSTTVLAVRSSFGLRAWCGSLSRSWLR